MTLDQQIEGMLFYRSGPVKLTELQKTFEITAEDLKPALETLSKRLESGGTRLLQTDKEVQLVTAPELDQLIETLRKEELKRDIGKAGAETLAIILYREPVSRAEIDQVRGVNSAFILRNLLVRGLIARETNPKDSRSFNYRSTSELLQHLGITKKEDLPEYGNIMNQLDTYVSGLELEDTAEVKTA